MIVIKTFILIIGQLSVWEISKNPRKSKKNPRFHGILDFFLDFSQFGCQLMLERVSRQLCPGQESHSTDIYDSYQNFYTLNWPTLSLGNLEKSKKIQEKIQDSIESWIFSWIFSLRGQKPAPPTCRHADITPETKYCHSASIHAIAPMPRVPGISWHPNCEKIQEKSKIPWNLGFFLDFLGFFEIFFRNGELVNNKYKSFENYHKCLSSLISGPNKVVWVV